MGTFSTNYCPRACFVAGTEEGTRVILTNNRDGATQLILGVHITGGGSMKQPNPQLMIEANSDWALPWKHLQSAVGKPYQAGKCFPDKEQLSWDWERRHQPCSQRGAEKERGTVCTFLGYGAMGILEDACVESQGANVRWVRRWVSPSSRQPGPAGRWLFTPSLIDVFEGHDMPEDGGNQIHSFKRPIETASDSRLSHGREVPGKSRFISVKFSPNKCLEMTGQ